MFGRCRCAALLEDVARLGRVADLARRGQVDSRAAAEAAATARLEVRGPGLAEGLGCHVIRTDSAAGGSGARYCDIGRRPLWRLHIAIYELNTSTCIPRKSLATAIACRPRAKRQS